MDKEKQKDNDGNNSETKENSNSSRRCGQIGEGEDDALTMVDVLNEQARLQVEADAVLGGSDAHNCTYPEGYQKRQALYACVTCTPEGNAGVCLACCLACHEGHDLVELYTKRNFACDCGNEKFGNTECKLYQARKKLNASNRYNQNFKGLYCSCHRPYPDPEDSIEDDMIQCIMCEDWYHGRHLKTTVPEEDDYDEMICPGCMSKYSFLWAYYVKNEVTRVEPGDTNEDVDIASTSDSMPKQESTSLSPIKPNNGHHSGTTESSAKSNGDTTSVLSGKRGAGPDQEEPPAKMAKKENGEQNKVEESPCILASLEKRLDRPDEATFWTEGWRKKLCKCLWCMDMYKDREIEFLVDEGDTVQTYESKGKSQPVEEVDEASALAGMGRVQQIEMVRGFMDLKTELNEFLQGFARDGKVVKETDINEFFERMNQKRRRQVHVPQSSCR